MGDRDRGAEEREAEKCRDRDEKEAGVGGTPGTQAVRPSSAGRERTWVTGLRSRPAAGSA